jgi:GNAT superfamily N-acetyltransferase
MNYGIQLLSPGQLPSVAELARQIWPISYAGILTSGQIENLLMRIYSEENLQKEMRAGHVFWGAYDKNDLVGYASVYKEEETIWLKKLYVLPQLQGKGIGTLLMKTAVTALSPAKKLNLFVNCNNLPAQHFYERSGFACIEEVPVKMGDFDFIDRVYSKSF